ncbi:hypothetical protein ACFFJT_20560 [Dyella flava]|uniref:PH domain-containing protein n=1 Tax=Dyella flava TaxID=1920170 RepID=A0ABS2K6P4_9GAMM|nr:hypothetical protein [Dyella flava]MBM7125993.1 hypothetical protein [Dyella flava]GLQ52512.1 hypothetical protein GCM10010872_39610 [Dyella flava]
MIVGLSYLIVAIALPLIMLVMRSTSRGDSGNGDEFRYQSGWAPVMLVFSGVPVVAALVILVVMWPNVSGIQFLIVALVAAAVSCYFVYGYRYLKDFCISADDGGIEIKTVWGAKKVGFDQIKKIVLLQGGRGEEVLEVYDASEKRVLRLTDSLNDLQGLCGLLRMRAGKFGAVYKRRDKWGKWS